MENGINNQLNKIIYFLNKSWSKDTCYPSMQQEWSEKNKSLGQCAITSLIVNDYFDGDICKCEVNGISHYFNQINNETIDLTKEQFGSETIKYENIKKKTRNQILDNSDTKNRYEVLKLKLEQYLKELDKLNKEINSCFICNSLVEKFDNKETIYIGRNPQILLLGEAPANNGWRKSKMLWRDINGKILPSGIIMQKLLKPLNIDLFDLSFTEAVKCYPKERNNLKKCNQNCNNYLTKQIQILEPNIIISLGDYATRNILNFQYKKFGDVVGKVFEIKLGNQNVKVLPIYHPSPISPLSYKGNISTFEKLKEIF
jgi:uracil-DNA glycosylase family 4